MRDRTTVREMEMRSRSQMHCIHIINRFKIISSLFRNSPDNLL
ncbi:hypothetical protein HMPREF1617_00929 [Escherichia coli 908675]|nr:hypothetical protein HMPREF1594_04834 [Escherichia coli 907446]ESD21526.1 hypothetical protein HMPREF1597_02483 [Escherichia coli 907701]ESD40210.1 hypothetical protein HMPREF1604_02806 [Escherichia coli 908519]ESE05338.1 hypothetical protein HMPREF1614_00328 [Escherichia coli 908624]ESE20614.1 hypothetical protein HMPREF1617_00929 [Escherichia coli 908675]ESE27126.1 hypothetical protein HMPREF1623_00499 [Escherichia coli 910096-2]ESE38679.1 hypothetical protein HMPREF1622_00423 [Escherich